MLSCREVTERASAWLDGELTLGQRMSMRMHLAMCAHCRRFNRHFRLLIDSLHRQAEMRPVTPDFVSRVISAAAGTPRTNDSD